MSDSPVITVQGAVSEPTAPAPESPSPSSSPSPSDDLFAGIEAAFDSLAPAEPEVEEPTPEPVPEPEPEPTPTPEPEPTPAPEPEPEQLISDEPSYISFRGQEYPAPVIQEALMARNFFVSLPDGALQAIDGLLSGQYVLAPAQPQPGVAQPSQPFSQPFSTAGGEQPATPPGYSGTGLPADQGEYLDPRAEAEIARLRAELQSQQQAILPLIQQQQEQQRQQLVATIDTVQSQIAAQYNLTDSESAQLVQEVTNRQIIPRYMQMSGGNPELAFRQALEATLYDVPSFREKVISKRAALEAEKIITQQTLDNQAALSRQQLASAVSGSGASTSRLNPTPMSALNPVQLNEAMADDIAGMLRNGTPQG